jgi:inosine/xanthosine triphosphatase
MQRLTIALGSTRGAKVEAVRAAVQQIAQVDEIWVDAEIITLEVKTDAPAMPLSDEELMSGAKARARAVGERLVSQPADFYVGLEGGFHSLKIDGELLTFLRGWAYVTNGEVGNFGAGPSIRVPDAMVKLVVEGRRELGEVIDEVAGELDVRSRQGAWGVLSKDLMRRSMTFEIALIAAFAPFYNPRFYC